MTRQTHGKERTEEESETEQVREQSKCPECGGRVLTNGGKAESVCADCGLVVDDQQIDHGPEWRAFDATQKDEKSRVGAPTTKMMHDDGLSTNIGWQNKDAYGNALSSRKRKKFHRLRTWNERLRTRDSKERNLKQALGEIDRMASALGIDKSTREFASVIYRRALDENLLPGRSIEGVATAALYAATRLNGVARPVSEIAVVSRVEELEIQRAYRYIVRKLNLRIPPTDPIEYVGRVTSELDCSDEIERLSRELIETATEQGVHSGKHPVGFAASAVYAAGKLCNAGITQGDVSDVADVSKVTIRNRYREILETFEAAKDDES